MNNPCHSLRTALLLLFITLTALTHATYNVDIIATDPPGNDITLGLDQKYSVQVAYRTDEPIRIWIRPFFKGQEVPTTTNASPTYTGEGEALGWFASTKPVQVDEIRVLIGSSSTNAREAISHPVNIQITGSTTRTHPPASWVPLLLEQSRIAHLESQQEAITTPPSIFDAVIVGVFSLATLTLFLGGITFPIIAFNRWEGPWRIAAAIPLVILAAVVIRIIIDTSIDPTSHNLWPFEILTWALMSTAAITIMKLIRIVTRRSTT